MYNINVGGCRDGNAKTKWCSMQQDKARDNDMHAAILYIDDRMQSVVHG